MRLSDFYYDLPQELIAQKPLDRRDGSRLLCLNRQTHEMAHRHFSDILEYFNEGDCLVLNDSRVIPARLYAVRRDTGAIIEVFLLRPTGGADVWECLCKPGKKTKIGTVLDIDDVQCEVLDIAEDGNRTIRFTYDGDVTERLKQLGEMPLPPYIHEKLADANRYQTVYAKYDGSVAAPTAGLHFTEELLEKIREKGVEIGYVTLHVGLGTFRPVKVDDPTKHKMHSEYYILPQQTVDMINRTKARGGKVTAVGTTSVRVLETAGRSLPLKAQSGETDIFIYPGFEFHVIDRLITNFHLPESTLIMLVSALVDRETILAAYAEAVREKYRFFSFGDAMFIY